MPTLPDGLLSVLIMFGGTNISIKVSPACPLLTPHLLIHVCVSISVLMLND